MAFLEAQFEDEIKRNPYLVKTWWNYVQSKLEDPSPLERFSIFERALTYLPRSYKLWHAYLNDRTQHLKKKSVTSKKYDYLIDTFERALVYMNKMPRIWLDYGAVMIRLKKTTAARRVFDRALEALPITQHQEVWKLYVDWAHGVEVPETAIRVYRRYLMFDAAYREEYVGYLLELGQYEEAARQLVVILNDPQFVSPTGQTQHQLWMKLCDVCCKHPESVADTISVEDIIRSGISKFSDEVARLWTSLADYYIRLGQFERARDVYEEALNSVNTVRDFTVIFDTYIKVEERILTAKMKMLSTGTGEGEEGGEDDEEGMTEEERAEEMVDVNLRLARIEYLMEQRPLMVNSVNLRQNPQSVKDWVKRVKLYKDDDQRVLLTVQEAIKTVHPRQAVGKLSSLYKIWASVLEHKGNLAQARAVYERAIYVNYKTTEELAEVWCAYAEMESRAEKFSQALDVMGRAVQDPSIHSRKKDWGMTEPETTSAYHSIDRLFKNTQVWAMYLDLEEALGAPDTVRAAYDRCMELKVITPNMLLHYAAYLEDLNFFEEAFTVYERGVELFGFPQVKVIYARYIDKFVARYQGRKLERLRDIFETLLSRVPASDCAEYYIRYAKLEEQFGLARQVMAILERAVAAVPDKLRLDMYRLHVKKVEQHYGLIKTRSVYDAALKKLDDRESMLLCLEYAAMERTLNEIDRARAIYVYGAQFADPRREGEYYRQWREFEEAHGNEETFREMLRVQRSVQITFAQVSYLATDMLAETAGSTGASAAGASQAAVPGGSGAALPTTMDRMAQQAEEAATQLAGKRRLVSSGEGMADDVDGGASTQPPLKQARNEEEIDI